MTARQARGSVGWLVNVSFLAAIVLPWQAAGVASASVPPAFNLRHGGATHLRAMQPVTSVDTRSVWWDGSWPYRIPLRFNATVSETDAIARFSIPWKHVLSTVHAPSTLDPKSLRLVEYTPGGHVIPAYRPTVDGSNCDNRFYDAPVASDGEQRDVVWALAPGRTRAGETRHFMLYFDTLRHPKVARDFHYLQTVEDSQNVTVARAGPNTECNIPSMPVSFARDAVGTMTFGSDLTVQVPAIQCGRVVGTGNGIVPAPTERSRIEGPVLRRRSHAGASTDTCGLTASVDTSTSSILTTSDDLARVDGSARLTLPAGYSRPAGSTTVSIAVSSHGSAVRPDIHLPILSLNGTIFSVRQPSTTVVRRGNVTLAIHAHQRLIGRRSVNVSFTLMAGAGGTSGSLLRQLSSRTNSVHVTVGAAGAYTPQLLERQFHLFENQAWTHILHDVVPHGWYKPWNITYSLNRLTGSRGLAHDNDSSMGAGFVLYAAALKATMTGAPEYYTIANAYAHYFLALEAEDIAEHGGGVAGRISYGFNGGPAIPGLCGVPAYRVVDCTSIDQMSTAAWGLLQYSFLPPRNAPYTTAVKNLLCRMSQYAEHGGPNLVPNSSLHNLCAIATGRGTWRAGAPSHFPLPGTLYNDWLQHKTTALNTGAGANTFFIAGLFDRILPDKDPDGLRARYVSVVNDTGTATKGYYPLVRGLSYPAAWGYTDWEFPRVAMLRSTAQGLVAQAGDPSSYQLLAGGARDGISGRMTEQAAVVAWAAMNDPNGRMQVAGHSGPTYSDYTTESIHTIIACLMMDDGGIRDTAQGSLGKFSAVNSDTETVDFSGYFLTLMDYYDLSHSQVEHPVPSSNYDYVIGESSTGGTTTVGYLGDGTIQQTVALPSNNALLSTGGAIDPLTLQYGSAHGPRDTPGRPAHILVHLRRAQLSIGTMTELPVRIAPATGTISVRVLRAEPGGLSFMAGTHRSQRATITVIHPVPSHTVCSLRNQHGVTESRARSGSGVATLHLVGTGGTDRFTLLCH